MSTAPQPPIRRRPGWLGVVGTSLAIFLVVLALLWVRVSAGEDPVLGVQSSAAQVTTTSSDTTSAADDDTTSSDSSSSADTTTSPSSSADVPATHAS
jgi:cytoskeletal protein RodZ